MYMDLGLLLLSFVMLFYGAEFALEGSERIGAKLGLSPLVIGMVLVGIGTSLPELFVSQIAVHNSKVDLAIGSLVGSNIANIYLILGISALIVPLVMGSEELKQQLYMHFLLYIIVGTLFLTNTLNWIAGIILIVYIFFNLVLIYRFMKKHPSETVDAQEVAQDNVALLILKMLLGFVLLYFGGDYLVKSGTNLCLSFGISEYVISAILVAFGTSFPELVTALMAAVKKKDQDLIVGNIIGSNVFNLGLIFGSICFYDLKTQLDLKVEFFLLLLVSFFFIVLNVKKSRINKFSGVIFLLMYAKMVFYWIK